jgi:hypothetical protein
VVKISTHGKISLDSFSVIHSCTHKHFIGFEAQIQIAQK